MDILSLRNLSHLYAEKYDNIVITLNIVFVRVM